MQMLAKIYTRSLRDLKWIWFTVTYVVCSLDVHVKNNVMFFIGCDILGVKNWRSFSQIERSTCRKLVVQGYSILNIKSKAHVQLMFTLKYQFHFNVYCMIMPSSIHQTENVQFPQFRLVGIVLTYANSTWNTSIDVPGKQDTSPVM